MKLILTVAAAAALALPAAATAQDSADGWHLMTSQDGFLVGIDTKSIKADGGGRLYTMRLSKQGDANTALFDLRADCAARTVQVLHGYQIAGGKKTEAPNMAGAPETVDDDPSGKAMLDYVCQAPLAG
ncbi:hypothetical protein [Sphingomonas sp.]|uniref:hypothetical protein n=1 Tax=Sphingomonas sp. TaxID=28214 RepID=UPI001B12D322|nr:hypothetical protein [Sphingomonas sp.]MBO9711273.1 hypothetical protein [Sphingomonas sp.]